MMMVDAGRSDRATGVTVSEALDRYMSAIRAGDRRRAIQEVDDARAGGLDIRTIYLDVLQPALRMIGQLWQENALTVAEEHLATAITQSAMLRVYADLRMPEADGPILIAACADTERHEIGLRMLCDFLDVRGWETVFLGASVPAEGLIEMVRQRAPDAIALSASILPHLPQVRSTISQIREAVGEERQPTIIVGGRPFLERPHLAETMGADLTASDAWEAADLLDRRVR